MIMSTCLVVFIFVNLCFSFSRSRLTAFSYPPCFPSKQGNPAWATKPLLCISTT